MRKKMQFDSKSNRYRPHSVNEVCKPDPTVTLDYQVKT